MNQPIELNHVFEIYVPSECICGELLPEIEREEALDEIKSTISLCSRIGVITGIDLCCVDLTSNYQLN